MRNGRKKLAVWIALALLVPLAVLIGFTPWSRLSGYALDVRSIRVVVLGAAICAVLVSTLPARERAVGGKGLRRWRIRFVNLHINPYLLVLFGVAGAAAFVLLAQVMLRSLWAGQTTVLVMSMAGQQLCLLLAAYLICCTDRRIAALDKALAEVIIGIVAALFSVATPTIVRTLAEHLRFASMHDATVVFSLPVLLVVAICLFKIAGQASR